MSSSESEIIENYRWTERLSDSKEKFCRYEITAIDGNIIKVFKKIWRR